MGIGSESPASGGEGGVRGKSGGEEMRRGRVRVLSGEEHVPLVVAMGESGVGEFDNVGERGKAVSGIEDFGLAHGGTE